MWSVRLAWQIEFCPNVFKDRRRLNETVYPRLIGIFRTWSAPLAVSQDIEESLSA